MAGCSIVYIFVAVFGFFDRVHIRCCGNGYSGFRPYGEALFSNAKKVPKKARPGVRPLAKARGSFAPVSIRGHCPQVGFATTYMQRVRLRRTALRATPRMNTSTQPPEGAGGSRSRAAGELTLGLMSGDKRRCTRPPVGASLLAMVVNDNACLLVKRGALESIASELAPTGDAYASKDRPAGRPPRFGFGGARSLRGPRNRTGARACRALARHRTKCMVSPSSATQH